jgi:hypothetical protein
MAEICEAEGRGSSSTPTSAACLQRIDQSIAMGALFTRHHWLPRPSSR